MKHNLPISDVKPEPKAKPEIIEPPAVRIRYGKLSLPLGPLPGYLRRRIDTNRLTRQQSETLASIASGLQHQEAKLKDGTIVRGEAHAIKWVLENLG